MGRVARLGVGWLGRGAVLYALWLALIDNVHRSDLITGLPCAALAAALATAVDVSRTSRAHPRPGMFLRVPLTLVMLVTDTVRLTWALVRTLAGRPVHGRFRAVAYPTTTGDPAAAGRRALSEIAGSLAPNRYVLGIDPEREVMVVHELLPSSAPLDPLGPA